MDQHPLETNLVVVNLVVVNLVVVNLVVVNLVVVGHRKEVPLVIGPAPKVQIQ